MSWVYWAPKSSMRIFWCLLDPVIGSLLHDLHVVHVRFPNAGGGDLDELRASAHLVDGGAAGVAHARAQAAGELLDHPHRAAFVRHPALDALGHELVDVHVRVLEIAVGRAFLHGAERAHPAIGLVRAALVELELPWRLVGAGEERAEHHDMRARGDCLGDIARVAHAAVGDERHAGLLERRGHVLDGRDLWHADAGDDARRADRAGADADLHAVRAMIDERPCAIAGADVAADDLYARIALLDPLHTIEHALRMAMRGVHDEHVGAGLHQGGDALIGAFAYADRRADAQLPVRVLARVRVLDLFQDVLDGDEALQVVVVVDHEHALEAVPVHERHRLLAARAFAHRDELLLRRHDVLHWLVEILLEAQVAVGDDAHHLAAVLHHRKAGNLVALLQRHHFAHGHVRRDGHRITQHTGLEALHLCHLRGLHGGAQVLVDDADAAFLRYRDGEPCLGDGVHCRRDEWDVELELSRQAAFQRGITRQDARVGGQEEYIVEGQRLLDHPHGIAFSQSGILHECSRL